MKEIVLGLLFVGWALVGMQCVMVDKATEVTHVLLENNASCIDTNSKLINNYELCSAALEVCQHL